MLKYLSYGYLAFIAIIILYANMGWDLFVFDLIEYVPFKDKLSHFLLVGVLTLAVNNLFNFRRIKLSKYNFLLGSVLVFSFFTLEEASQAFLVNRNCELLDFICNSLGIIIFEKIGLKINSVSMIHQKN